MATPTTTYPPNVTATVRLIELKDDGVLIPTIEDPNTLTLAVYAKNGTQVGSTLTVAGSGIVGDGAGTYTAHLPTPPTPGSYYLQWDMLVENHIGQKTYDFQVRPRTG